MQLTDKILLNRRNKPDKGRIFEAVLNILYYIKQILYPNTYMTVLNLIFLMYLCHRPPKYLSQTHCCIGEMFLPRKSVTWVFF